MNVVGISGSPARHSRSNGLLRLAKSRLEAGPLQSFTIVNVRDLPIAPLADADLEVEPLREAVERVMHADLVIVATPVYKAAYSGLIKLFLDALPPDALSGRTVLPLATGGSVAHLLVLDYALKPVLSALGARDILDGVFVTDAQLQPHPSDIYLPDDDVVARLDRALHPFVDARRRHDAASAPAAVRCRA